MSIGSKSLAVRSGFGETWKTVAVAFVLASALILPCCGPRDAGPAKAHKGALHQYKLGARRYREGDFEAAIKIYEKALQIDPNLAAAHLDLGIIYDDYRTDKKRAIAHYKEYLRLEPKSEKAEMVMRWVHSAEEEKSDGTAAQSAASAQTPGAGGAENSGMQAELQQARQDAANLRTEKDAYLKTVETLREELSQAKQQLGALLAKGRAEGEEETGVATGGAGSAVDTLARSLESEKAQLLERYQREKGQVEKTIEALKGEIAGLQAQKKASDEALKKSNERFEALRKAASEEKGGQPADDALRQKLVLVNEKCAELQREGAIYMKDNKALLSRLKKAERDLEDVRSRGSAGAAAQSAPPPAPAALAARVKADGEKDKEDLRRAYEKKLMELTSASAREKAELQRALAESQRASSPPPPPAVPAVTRADLEKAVARVKAGADREKEDLRLGYEKKLSELGGSSGRDKVGVQRELADARREALYFKAQVEREKEKAARAGQAQVDAIRRLNEQHRREKAELEKRLYAGQEKHPGARTAAQGQASGGTMALPLPKAPVREAAPSNLQKGAEPRVRKSTAGATPKRYQVARGDSLQSISLRFYGTADRWKAIYDANRGILSTPNAPLRAGKILAIP